MSIIGFSSFVRKETRVRAVARVAAAQAGTPIPKPNPRPNPGAGALNGALGNTALGNGIAGDAFGSAAEIKVPKFKMPSPRVPSPKPPVSPKADLGALLPPEVRAQIPLIKSALPPAKTGSSGGKTPFQDRPLDRLAINHERRAGGLAPVDWRAVDQGKAAYLRDGEHTRPLNPALKVRPVTDLAGDLRRDLVAAARSGDPAAVPRVLNRRLTQAKRIQGFKNTRVIHAPASPNRSHAATLRRPRPWSATSLTAWAGSSATSASIPPNSPGRPEPPSTRPMRASADPMR